MNQSREELIDSILAGWFRKGYVEDTRYLEVDTAAINNLKKEERQKEQELDDELGDFF